MNEIQRKRTRDTAFQRDNEESTENPAKKSVQPLRKSDVDEMAVALLVDKLKYSEERATESYNAMLGRLKALLKSKNLLAAAKTGEKQQLKEVLDAFVSHDNNKFIFSLFSTKITKYQAVHTICEALRHNITDGGNRVARRELPQETQQQTPAIPAQQTLYVSSIGFSEKTTFLLKNRANDQEPVWMGDCESLLDEEKSQPTAKNLRFKIFLEQVQELTTFDPGRHVLFAIIKDQDTFSPSNSDRSMDKIIINEKSWQQHLRVEGKRSSHFRFEYAEAKSPFSHEYKCLKDTMDGDTFTVSHRPSPARGSIHETIETGDKIVSPPYISEMESRADTEAEDSDDDTENAIAGDDLTSEQPDQGDPTPEQTPHDHPIPTESSEFNPYETESDTEKDILQRAIAFFKKRSKQSDRGEADNEDFTIDMLLDKNLTDEEHTSLMSHLGDAVIERMDAGLLERCAKFYHIKIVDLYRRDFKCDLEGAFKKGLQVHQLYAIYYFLEREIDNEQSGFLCDAPGVGKTFVTMALVVISYLFIKNRSAVERSREAKDGKHLQKHAAGKCPTSSGYFFQCACEKNSMASRYRPTHGINILTTPPSAIPKMLTDFQDLVPTAHGFKLYTDTKDKADLIPNINLWDLKAMDRWAYTKEYEPKSGIEGVLLVMNPSNWNKKIVLLEERLPHAKRKFREAFVAKVVRDEEEAGEEPWTNEQRKGLLDDTFPFHIGRLIADEAHLYHTEGSDLHKFLLRTNNQIRIIPQTGTQMSNQGLRSMESWVKVFCKHNNIKGQKTEQGKILDAHNVHALNNTYANAITNRDLEKMERAIKGLATIMKECNMIQRDGLTNWMDGQAVVVCPPVTNAKYHLSFEKSEHWKDYFSLLTSTFKNLKETSKIDDNEETYMNKFKTCAKKLLIGATFPKAAREFAKEVPKYNGNKLDSPFERYKDDAIALANSSTKFKHFNDNLLPRWSEEHTTKKADDPKAHLGKILLFFEHPFSAVMFYLALKDRYGADSTHGYFAKMKIEEKFRLQAIFDTDQAKINGLSDEDKEIRQKARFICTTYLVASTAIDLRACTKVVLVEPSHQAKNEDQAIARAARTGQNEKVEVIRYTATDPEVALAGRNNAAAKIKALAARLVEDIQNTKVQGETAEVHEQAGIE